MKTQIPARQRAFWLAGSALISAGAALLMGVVRAQVAKPISGLETVVVTAQRRSQNLQRVPVAVTALTSDFIQKNNIHSLTDLAASVPSLVVTGNVSYGLAPVSIRGLGGPSGGGSNFNAEPVGIYVDGVYVSQLGQAISDLLDVSGIEVLRGPQGTLYGRNSTAGAVLINSNRPTVIPMASLRASYDTLNAARVEAVVSGPVHGDDLLGRIAVSGNTGGDWATNTATGRKIGGSQGYQGRGTLEYRPDSTTKIDLIADTSHSRSNPVTVGLATVYPINTASALGTVYGGNPFAQSANFSNLLKSKDFYYDSPQYSVTDSTDFTLLGTFDLGFAKLDNVTGLRDFRVRGSQDGDALDTLWPLDDNRTTQHTTNYSEELRLSSPDDARLSWIGGIYYAHQQNSDFIEINSYQGGVPIIPVPATPFPAGLALGFTGTQTVDAVAPFVNGTYKFNDQWSLTAGGRYSWEQKSVAIEQSVATLVPSAIGYYVDSYNACPNASISCAGTYRDFSPRVVLNYQYDPSTLFYASYSQGFNSGGFNNFGDVGDPTDPTNPLTTKSETNNAYELGAKTTLLDNRARLNLALFRYDYSNLQIREAVYTGGVSVVNVPSARSQGVELEAQYKPVDDLTLSANGSFLDAVLKKGYLAAIPTNIGTILYGQLLTVPLVNIVGNHMSRAPEWQGNLAAEYRIPASYGDWRLGGDWRYQGTEYFSEVNQNSENYKSDPWREFDVHAAFDASGAWSVQLAGHNILDNRHITQVAPFVGFPVATLNQPADWTLTFSVRY